MKKSKSMGYQLTKNNHYYVDYTHHSANDLYTIHINCSLKKKFKIINLCSKVHV